MNDIIFLGPPGSGKGTQAKRLAKKIDAIYFGTGDLMREEAKSRSLIGKKFQAVWDEGKGALIPEELVTQFVEKKISEIGHEKTIVFDGYPRSMEQVRGFEKFYPHDNYIVLNIDVEAKNLIQRMSTRKVCSNCGKIFINPKADLNICDECGGQMIKRQEDRPEIISQRIAVYERETAPLIKYYNDKKLLINIDGNPPIDVVEKEIDRKINESRNIHKN